LSILDQPHKDVLSSGDPQEDLDARTGFRRQIPGKHRFVTEPDGTATLIVGAENWPFPILLVSKPWFLVLRYAGRPKTRSSSGASARMNSPQSDGMRELVEAQNNILRARR